jgi:hypothetical protein
MQDNVVAHIANDSVDGVDKVLGERVISSKTMVFAIERFKFLRLVYGAFRKKSVYEKEGSEVLTAVIVKSSVLRYITQYSPLKLCRCSG